MKAHVAKSVIGYLAFDDNQKLLSYKLFKLTPGQIASKLEEDIDQGFIKSMGGFEVVEDEFALKTARKNIRDIAIHTGFSKNDDEFSIFVSQLGHEMSRKKLSNSIQKDQVVVQASGTLESMSKLEHVLTEHLKEWFWLHYPEFKADNMKIIEYVSKYGSREKFPEFSSSHGIPFDSADSEIISRVACQIKSLEESKKEIEEYLSKKVDETAPNLSCLIDKRLAARLIALAGSLEKLAKMPSGSIQLMGAEKALFRHLKNRKSKPPKFGIIFESPYVRNAPPEKAGKAARILAAYLSKAAKIDFYSKRDEKEELKTQMEKELARL